MNEISRFFIKSGLLSRQWKCLHFAVGALGGTCQATDHGIAREARSITVRHIDQGPVVEDGVLLEARSNCTQCTRCISVVRQSEMLPAFNK